MHKSIINKITVVGLLINIVLSVLKYIFGVYGKSSALIADAIHSSSDIISDIAILIGLRYWYKPADDEHSYGHRKIETLVTLFISLILLFIGFKFIYNGVFSIINRVYLIPSSFTLIILVISIISKEILFRWNIKVGKHIKSSALIANAWHHRSDALSSIPVILAIAISTINPNFAILDSVASIVVSIFILKVALNIIKESYLTLADSSAPKEILDKIKNICKNFKDIDDNCTIKSRYLGYNAICVDLIVKVDGAMKVKDADELSHALSKKIINDIDEIVDVFVHVDPK